MRTKPIDEIETVGILGAGTMGCYISIVVSLAGYKAILYDVAEDVLKSVPQRQKGLIPMFVEGRGVPSARVEDAASLVQTTTDPNQVGEKADLIWETVPEILELKRAVFQQFDEICPAKTIFVSNTSTLLVSEIEDCVKRREQFAALHIYFRGALIDIVGGPKTSPEVMETLIRFTRSMNQLPIVLKKEKAGYLQNSLLNAVVKEAFRLVAHGYSNIEDVDRCWMIVQSARVGPFGIIDGIGLDVAFYALEAENERTPSEDLQRLMSFLRPYIDKGNLGRKTGKGFYTYPEPSWEKLDFLTEN